MDERLSGFAPGAEPDAQLEPNSGAPVIFIATPMYGGMAMGTYAASLAQTPAVFLSNGLGLYYMYRMNDSLVTCARNNLVHQFLSTKATHLMWIDADIGFNPMDIVSMVKADEDIVCGLYPKKEVDWARVAQAVKNGVPPDELHSYVGSFVVNLIDGSKVAASGDSRGLVEIASGGAGFMLVKRAVYEAMADHVPAYVQDRLVMREFYATGIEPASGSFFSEDYHFCLLARRHGFKIYAAPWVRLSHAGTYVFDSRI